MLLHRWHWKWCSLTRKQRLAGWQTAIANRTNPSWLVTAPPVLVLLVLMKRRLIFCVLPILRALVSEILVLQVQLVQVAILLLLAVAALVVYLLEPLLLQHVVEVSLLLLASLVAEATGQRACE
jgi:hypothetical protein